METNGLKQKAEQWRVATARPLAELGQQALDRIIERDIVAEGAEWKTQVDSLAISDQATYETAAELLKIGSERVRLITDTFEEPRELSNSLHKLMTSSQSLVLDPYKQGVDAIGRKIGAYDAQKAREREAEARRLQEEARKQQVEEAAAIALQHKQELIDQGVSRKDAEAARREVERDIKTTPVVAAAPAPNVQRVQGVSVRKPVVKGEVISLMTLVKAVAVGKAGIEFLQINESALNGHASKGFPMPPGTRAVADAPKAHARR